MLVDTCSFAFPRCCSNCLACFLGVRRWACCGLDDGPAYGSDLSRHTHVQEGDMLLEYLFVMHLTVVRSIDLWEFARNSKVARDTCTNCTHAYRGFPALESTPSLRDILAVAFNFPEYSPWFAWFCHGSACARAAASDNDAATTYIFLCTVVQCEQYVFSCRPPCVTRRRSSKHWTLPRHN